jgi:membrane peptidoglycan carboxypeptidase
VQVLDPNVARTETKMLFGPVRNGTAARTLSTFPRPAAGKTGTTDANVDAWFVGYTPQFTAAVWMGDPNGEVAMRNIGGTGPVFGAGYPAKIWRAFMGDATASLPVVQFAEPAPTSVRPRFITELGRKLTFVPSQSATTTTVPVTPTSVVTPTTVKKGHKPPVKTPTTAHKPPPTTPHTTPATAPSGP